MQTKEQKAKTATRLAAQRASRTTQQQLELLYSRPGNSHKEVTRLRTLLINNCV